VEQQSQTPSGGSGLAPNVASLLCYICGIVTGVIFLLIDKDNKDVKFHAFQSIFLNVAVIALWIAITILTFILSAIHLGFLMLPISLIAWLGILVIGIMAMVKAYQGERWQIPIIGKIAEQQANK
jgi:uncharacterized membrane protein